MDEVEGALEVHGDDSVPLCLSHAQHQSVLGDTGVVDQNLHRAKVCDNLLHGSLGLRKVSSVAGVALGLHTQRVELTLGLQTAVLLVDSEVGEGDVSTFLSETQGNSLADTTGSTGDERGLTLQ